MNYSAGKGKMIGLKEFENLAQNILPLVQKQNCCHAKRKTSGN
jgi:hypothetical protein